MLRPQPSAIEEGASLVNYATHFSLNPSITRGGLRYTHTFHLADRWQTGNVPGDNIHSSAWQSPRWMRIQATSTTIKRE